MPISANRSSKVPKQHPRESARTSTLIRTHWKFWIMCSNEALPSDTFCLLFLCCLERATFISCLASFKAWFHHLVKPHLPHFKHLIYRFKLNSLTLDTSSSFLSKVQAKACSNKCSKLTSLLWVLVLALTVYNN